MAITDVYHKNGNMKKGAGVANAIHWLDIQQQLKGLTFKQFKEVVFPVIEHFKEDGV